MNQSKQEILRIEPVFKQMIWGGSKLRTKWGYDIPGDNTGECWAVSAHQHGDCKIADGSLAGKTLSQLWTEHPELFGNVDSDRFPLLVKIIDAKGDLSIQVHPDDAYAAANENGSFGKAECWYILDATEGATLVVGHNAKDKTELDNLIREGRWDELIRKVPVKAGDFIQIDFGTVHSINGGIQLLEIQKSSDITYRVYDYDRLQDGKPRELHIKKSIDVITVPARPLAECIMTTDNSKKNTFNELISCECYRVWKLDVIDEMQFVQEYPFLIMSVLAGEGSINGQHFKRGDHFILPDGYGNVHIQGDMELIASTIG